MPYIQTIDNNYIYIHFNKLHHSCHIYKQFTTTTFTRYISTNSMPYTQAAIDPVHCDRNAGCAQTSEKAGQSKTEAYTGCTSQAGRPRFVERFPHHEGVDQKISMAEQTLYRHIHAASVTLLQSQTFQTNQS